MRFPLAFKGIFLIAVPLAIEFLSLGWMWSSVVDANNQAKKEAYAQDIAVEASKVLIQFFSLGSKVYAYRAAESADEIENFQSLERTMKGATGRLVLKGKDLDDAEQAHIRRIEARMDGVLGLVGSYVREMSSPAHILGSFNVADFRERLIAQMEPVKEEIQHFTDLSKTYDTYGQWTKKASRQRHILLIVSLFTPNILIAIALALFYTRQIRNRIRQIDLNVTRFLNGRLLSSRMIDEDEISDLDAAFHLTTEKLIAADLEMQNYYDSMQKNLVEPLRTLREVLQASAATESPLTETGRAKVARSVGTADRLISLIEELGKLDKFIAEEQKLDIAECRLEEMLSSSIASVAEFAARKDISITLECKEDLSVKADSTRLIQLIVNLLSNAIKFSPPGSAVKVITSHTDNAFEVHVQDHGPGIPPNERARLFKRFEQIESIASKDIKGSGLGLSICRDVVAAHGGEIGVNSEVGKGSDFWFRIPL